MSFIVSFDRKVGEEIPNAVGEKYLVTAQNLKSFESWARASMKNTMRLRARLEEKAAEGETIEAEEHFLDIEQERMVQFLDACVDLEKESRDKSCLLCYYNKKDAVSQPETTQWRCQLCLHTFEHENTLHPVLCSRCAAKQGLCETCGAVHFQPTDEFVAELKLFCKEHFGYENNMFSPRNIGKKIKNNFSLLNKFIQHKTSI